MLLLLFLSRFVFRKNLPSDYVIAFFELHEVVLQNFRSSIVLSTAIMRDFLAKLIFVLLGFDLYFAVSKHFVCKLSANTSITAPIRVRLKDVKLNFNRITIEFNITSFFLLFTGGCFDYL